MLLRRRIVYVLKAAVVVICFFLLKYKQRCRVDFEFPMYKSTKMKDFNFKGVWVVRYNRNLVDNYFEKTFKIKYQK